MNLVANLALVRLLVTVQRHMTLEIAYYLQMQIKVRKSETAWGTLGIVLV